MTAAHVPGHQGCSQELPALPAIASPRLKARISGTRDNREGRPPPPVLWAHCPPHAPPLPRTRGQGGKWPRLRTRTTGGRLAGTAGVTWEAAGWSPRPVDRGGHRLCDPSPCSRGHLHGAPHQGCPEATRTSGRSRGGQEGQQRVCRARTLPGWDPQGLEKDPSVWSSHRPGTDPKCPRSL